MSPDVRLEARAGVSTGEGSRADEEEFKFEVEATIPLRPVVAVVAKFQVSEYFMPYRSPRPNNEFLKSFVQETEMIERIFLVRRALD